MKWRVLLAALGAIAGCVVLSATPGQSASGSASIDGLVVVTVDGRPTPVRRARVVVKSDVVAQTTDTDVDGRFHVDGLKAGTYRIDVTKFGFVPAGRTPAVVLADGQRQAPTIPMERAAAIEGRITSESGQPVAGIVVSAARLGFGPYGRVSVALQRTTTDDLGRYRLHTLSAGSYFLDVAPDPLQMINATTIAGQTRIPTRTYYSGAQVGSPRLNDARAIPVQTSQQISGVDFAVVTGIATTLRANVTTSSGARPASFSFRLERVGAPPGEVLCFVNPDREAEPTATCTNVPPGEYWALATSRSAPNAPAEFSATKVSIDGRAMANLSITTQPGAALSGRIEVEGGAALPANLRLSALETEFELPAAVPGQGTVTPPALIGPDGAFAIPSVGGPRLIRIAALPAGWAMKAVWLGNVDIADAPTAFESIGAPAVLRVVITAQTGTASGLVTDSEGRPAAGSRVVLFSKDSGHWGARSRFIATTETGPDGRYALRGLLPGDYSVVAREQMDEGAWEDPDVLATLQVAALPVTIAAGATVTADWKLRR